MTMTHSILLALIGHAMVFSLIGLSFHAVPRHYGMEFFFWGGIVRKEELSPGQPGVWGFSDGYAVVLPQGASADKSLRQSSVALDKSDMRQPYREGDLPEPLKFLGPRVSLSSNKDGEEGMRPVELPSPVKVRLRYPRP